MYDDENRAFQAEFSQGELFEKVEYGVEALFLRLEELDSSLVGKINDDLKEVAIQTLANIYQDYRTIDFHHKGKLQSDFDSSRWKSIGTNLDRLLSKLFDVSSKLGYGRNLGLPWKNKDFRPPVIVKPDLEVETK